MYRRLGAKAGQVAVGKVSVRLLGGGDRLVERQRAVEIIDGLLIPQRAERTRCRSVAFAQDLRLIDEPASKHLFCARVDTPVESFAIGIQPDAKNAESTERIASLQP